MTTVFFIAHAALYAEGLSGLLARDGRISVVGSASDWPQALERLRALPRPPDVLLLDLDTPSGVAAVRALSSELDTARLVALAESEDEEALLPWAEAGVSCVLSCDAALEDLVRAVEAAARGEATWSPRLAATLLSRFAQRPRGSRDGPRALTSREREIMVLIDRGLSNKEIASKLQIELPTVKNHVHHVLNKLNANRRGEAAAILRGERAIRRP